jgi:hypothetical protein
MKSTNLMKQLFLFFCMTLLVCSGFAQERCGHIEYLNYLYSKNPGLKKEHEAMNAKIREKLKAKKNHSAKTSVVEEVYVIPTVVHVIHNNASGAIGGHNISDAQVLSQITILNQDYRRLNPDAVNTPAIFQPVAADISIEFRLASLDPYGNPTTGINRVYNSQSSFAIGDEAKLKSLIFWPNDQYLNIWVCDISGGYLGYAQFPNFSTLPGIDPIMGYDPTDGVVIDYATFGNIGTSTYPYNGGRTTTHEIGHWLGLIHIWGDDYCGDDYVADTPTQEQLTSGSSCSPTYSTCTGPSTEDMIENYMDYSADACMNIFTQGQKDRMRTVMEVSPRRKSLLNSAGICIPGAKVTIPHKVDFEDFSYLSDHWKVLNFDASSSFSKRWKQVTPGAYGESNYAFMIENDSVYTSVDTTYVDMFESPYTNLTVANDPVFDFDIAYAYGTNSYETDSMIIYYNTGCKDKWIAFRKIDGNDLITTTRRTNNFVPEVNEWKKVTIDLGLLRTRTYVKFRIAVYSKGINKLYIDNVNFYKQSDQFTVNLYPVPTNEILNVEVQYTGYKNVKIEAFNTLGKKLFEREKTNTSSFVEPINTIDLGRGVYIFVITSGSNKETKKIVIN